MTTHSSRQFHTRGRSSPHRLQSVNVSQSHNCHAVTGVKSALTIVQFAAAQRRSRRNATCRKQLPAAAAATQHALHSIELSEPPTTCVPSSIDCCKPCGMCELYRQSTDRSRLFASWKHLLKFTWILACVVEMPTDGECVEWWRKNQIDVWKHMASLTCTCININNKFY
jgi:hypothetical protein